MELALPGLDCGTCGSRTCQEFRDRLVVEPSVIERCIHLQPETRTGRPVPIMPTTMPPAPAPIRWRDSLGREFDFLLDHFPEDPGPREVILPHNPVLTRELAVARGDIVIGRPLGMSCGCPVTHCGVVTDVDARTGVIAWCVTGPLGPRATRPKDIGYYSAQAYEGLVRDSRCDLAIGGRYFFQPRQCMLQWRHSGLVNYLNRTPDGMQVRLEGLFIG